MLNLLDEYGRSTLRPYSYPRIQFALSILDLT